MRFGFPRTMLLNSSILCCVTQSRCVCSSGHFERSQFHHYRGQAVWHSINSRPKSRHQTLCTQNKTFQQHRYLRWEKNLSFSMKTSKDFLWQTNRKYITIVVIFMKMGNNTKIDRDMGAGLRSRMLCATIYNNVHGACPH